MVSNKECIREQKHTIRVAIDGITTEKRQVSLDFLKNRLSLAGWQLLEFKENGIFNSSVVFCQIPVLTWSERLNDIRYRKLAIILGGIAGSFFVFIFPVFCFNAIAVIAVAFGVSSHSSLT